MIGLIYDLIFLLITIYVLLKVIGYAIYEIKTLHNKIGRNCCNCFFCSCGYIGQYYDDN
ncbi:MAG: hypothetical protein HFJ37_06270 [Clostridia bacterium]|nr:hypothetical protein [Clostridia bacterium]